MQYLSYLPSKIAQPKPSYTLTYLLCQTSSKLLFLCLSWPEYQSKCEDNKKEKYSYNAISNKKKKHTYRSSSVSVRGLCLQLLRFNSIESNADNMSSRSKLLFSSSTFSNRSALTSVALLLLKVLRILQYLMSKI